ncbi:chloride channel protein, partial [Streptomyces sp. WAC06614]|uniref:chloride channel protein n=1 Tax=Streptomyces sp. WAC06614 TaxID=2487416 RepID=UPI000FBD0D09
MLRSRAYLKLLVLAAVLGAPISALAYGFLALVDRLQRLTYRDLPEALGLGGTPVWWPLPLLALAGLLVGLTIRYLPGTGGHEPVKGMQMSGVAAPAELPGILLAALASLALGAVLGPEGPLIALGGGLAALVARWSRRELTPTAYGVIGATGSFAAVSTLLGSPLLGAFLLMEASVLGGAWLGVIMVPGLLAAGVGSLVFLGLGRWTGLGTYSLVLSDVPAAHPPDLGEFGWALVVGLAAAVVGTAIRGAGTFLQARVARARIPLSVAAGLAVGGLAIAYAEGSGKPATEVLYSGQAALDPLLVGSAEYTVGALLLLLVCKALGYAFSLSAFRGGPVFPSMFVGAVGGIALSHLPGLTLTAGFAMGVGAMSVAMLKLPLTSVMLATLLLGHAGITVMPLVIVAVAVCYTATAWLAPRRPKPGPGAGPQAGAGAGAGASA